jgi:hypothetical protein
VVEVSERPTSRERKIYIAVERRGGGGGVGVVLWWKWECFAAGREGNDNERWWVTGFGVVTVGKEGR